MLKFDSVKARQHAQQVLFHLSKSEGIREAGADPDGDMREAKLRTIALANELGMFCDPMDIEARESVEGKAAAE